MNLEDPFRAIEEWSGCAFSQPLRALLSSLGDTTVGNLAHFYAPADLLERNQTFETK